MYEERVANLMIGTAMVGGRIAAHSEQEEDLAYGHGAASQEKQGVLGCRLLRRLGVPF
jgi:hypothetical protein